MEYSGTPLHVDLYEFTDFSKECTTYTHLTISVEERTERTASIVHFTRRHSRDDLRCNPRAGACPTCTSCTTWI
jgi:hypothetical protein